MLKSFFNRQLAQKTKTFYYHFDHFGSFSIADLYIEKTWAILKKAMGFHTTSAFGVCHGDELMYLFRYIIPPNLVSMTSFGVFEVGVVHKY